MLKTLAIFGLPGLLVLLLVHRVIFRTRCAPHTRPTQSALLFRF